MGLTRHPIAPPFRAGIGAPSLPGCFFLDTFIRARPGNLSGVVTTHARFTHLPVAFLAAVLHAIVAAPVVPARSIGVASVLENTASTLCRAVAILFGVLVALAIGFDLPVVLAIGLG